MAAGRQAAKLRESLDSMRLELLVPAEAHAAELNAAILRSHAELKSWVPWAAEPPVLADTLEFCREARRRFERNEGLDLILLDRRSGELVGGSGFPRLDWSVPKFEIGYWCRTDSTGRGYIAEAVRRLCVYAFEELGAARVELSIDDRNVRSIGVAERLGFRQEGLLRSESRNPLGELRDTRIYAATAMAELAPSQPR